MVKLGAYISFLKKAINCGKVTRKCMANKGSSVRCLMQTHLSTSPDLPGMGEGTVLQMKMYLIFIKGNLCPALRQKGGEQRAFLVSAIFQLPSAQNNPYAKVAFWGRRMASPDSFQCQ